MTRFNNSWFRSFIWVVPIVILSWGFYVISISDPFYNSFPDPEYPYLINGMNVATSNYRCIYHVDHPGTPFQMYCGIVIKLTHLFTSEGNIAKDVLGTRPEFYLRSIQGSLVILHAFLVLLIGWVSCKRSINRWLTIVLQSGVLLLPWLFMRVNQERWLMTASLLLLLIYLLYGFRDKNLRKFAFGSGIIMAMAVATKFNYLPILLLPLLLLRNAKNRLIYIGTGLVSYVVFILPIIGRYDEHITFLKSIATHDGQYGSGEERMFNWSAMRDNFTEIFLQNPELLVFFAFIVAGIVLVLRRGNYSVPVRQHGILFVGILVILAAELFMVAKHYSQAYLIPIISVYPLLLLLFNQSLTDLIKQNRAQMLTGLAGLFFLLLAGTEVTEIDEKKQAIARREIIRKDVKKKVPEDALWIVTQPLWMRAPYIQSALCYAVSYSYDPRTYLHQLSMMNPNVYVLNGMRTKMERWRVNPTTNEAILSLQRPIHLYATPAHNHEDMFNYINQTAMEIGIQLKMDTLYSSPNNDEHILVVLQDSTDYWQPKHSEVYPDF